MKFAIISDIHANLEAFNRVLNDIDKMNCDEIICLGDIVGYGPEPESCINVIRENNIQCLMGNHDAAVCGVLSTDYFNMYAKNAVEWTIENISQDNMEYLKSLPFFAEYEDMLFVHGALNEPFDYILDVNSLNLNIEILQSDFPGKEFCFFGHTHIPFLSRKGSFELPSPGKHFLEKQSEKVFFINPGSIGQPRGGVTTKACYCIFDNASFEVNFRNIEYNIDKTYKAIVKKGLPEYLGARLYNGI